VSILDNAKQIAEAVHEIHNLELYQRVLALHSDVVGLVEQNIGLREEVAQLRKLASLKDKMRFNAPFYYQEGDKTPYCSACWEGDEKAVHLLFSHEEDACIRWDCKTCNQTFLIHKDTPRRRGNITPGAYPGDLSWMG